MIYQNEGKTAKVSKGRFKDVDQVRAWALARK